MSEPLELAEEFFDALWNRGDVNFAQELCADNFTDFTLPDTEEGDIVAFQDFVLTLRAAFPDLRAEVLDSYQDADYIILRGFFRGTLRAEYQGFAPAQKPLEWESIDILHVENEKLVERWAQNDLLEQLNESEEDFSDMQHEAERAELIGRLADFPAQLRAVIRANGVRLASSEAWSTAAIVGDLWRTEREVWQARLQDLARDENPSSDAREQDRFAREQEFGAADVNVLLDAFEFLRNATCEYLRGLAEEEWARGFGNVNVASLMTEAVLHDQKYLAQLSGAQL